jgi:hypothetical protein
MQKLVIKLTKRNGSPILIGVESIIDVKWETIKPYDKPAFEASAIRSREAMVTTNYVIESVEEIYNLINN